MFDGFVRVVEFTVGADVEIVASICICNVKACCSVCLDWVIRQCRRGLKSYPTVAEKLALCIANSDHEVTKFSVTYVGMYCGRVDIDLHAGNLNIFYDGSEWSSRRGVSSGCGTSAMCAS